MSRSLILTLLITMWISAIIAPSVVTIMQDGDQPGLVMNLNEEEQQEGSKNVKGENKLMLTQTCRISAVEYQLNSLITHMHKIMASSDMAEIILPPPEFTS